jgi:hypothetical protein
VRFGILFFLASALLAADAPQQPLPFSHKLHAGTMKVQCKMCHTSPDPGEMMTVAPASVCMQCHSAIKPIEKLAAAAKENKEIPWVRVYQIPSYVDFSHRAHLAASATCEDCHGKVAEREQLSKEGDISMGGCLKCHYARKVSTNCRFCHEPM